MVGSVEHVAAISGTLQDEFEQPITRTSPVRSHCHWVTAYKTRGLNIRRRRVPLAEIYCSISENFHIVYTNKTGELSVGMTPACGGVEVGGVVTLPAPHSLEG